MSNYYTLKATENQARGLAQYALDFINDRWPDPDDAVFERTELFHRDSIACAVAALGLNTNAPTVLRREAFEYPDEHGAACFGSGRLVAPEKAVLANCSAVRELDANGTNFGYNPQLGHTKGEFGHNDYYPVAIAAAQQSGWDGRRTLKAMVCLDEIRARLAEVFALRQYKIDHVLHGAIASAVVYGAIMGASAEQLESAIGLVVAHYVPFRAIRAGHQLSDSKGASAAVSSEVAVISARRAMRGFVGPADIFRNPQAIFCLFQPPTAPEESPFDLVLATHGRDFAVMGMHFKLGLYEHQSAGAIEGLINLLRTDAGIPKSASDVRRIRITIYEPAFSIIGDPDKRDPHNRQSADHSMVYIIATLLRKAIGNQNAGWQELMLMPEDYDDAALFHPITRELMQRIDFQHGGVEYDKLYPEGIPTSLEIELADGRMSCSGLVQFPLGHARGTSEQFAEVLHTKFQRLAALGVNDVSGLASRVDNIKLKSADDVRQLYEFVLTSRPSSVGGSMIGS